MFHLLANSNTLELVQEMIVCLGRLLTSQAPVLLVNTKNIQYMWQYTAKTDTSGSILPKLSSLT